MNINHRDKISADFSRASHYCELLNLIIQARAKDENPFYNFDILEIINTKLQHYQISYDSIANIYQIDTRKES